MLLIERRMSCPTFQIFRWIDGNVFRAVTSASTASGSASSCGTPARNFAFGNSTEISMMKTPSGQGSSERVRRMRGILLTPSGPRINPFESQLSTDLLQGPTFSPSVFSTVVSPSQEEKVRYCFPDKFWHEPIRVCHSGLPNCKFWLLTNLVRTSYGLLW